MHGLLWFGGTKRNVVNAFFIRGMVCTLQSTHPLYVAYTNHNRLLQFMSCTAPKMNSLQGWTDGFRGAVRVGFWYVWRCWRMHENHGHISGRYRLQFQVNSTVNWLVSLGSCPVDSGWFAAVNLSQHNFRWFLAKRMVITNALLLAAPIAVGPNFMTILMMVDTLMDRQCKVMLLLFCSSGVVISSYFANIICNLMRLGFSGTSIHNWPTRLMDTASALLSVLIEQISGKIKINAKERDLNFVIKQDDNQAHTLRNFCSSQLFFRDLFFSGFII